MGRYTVRLPELIFNPEIGGIELKIFSIIFMSPAPCSLTNSKFDISGQPREVGQAIFNLVTLGYLSCEMNGVNRSLSIDNGFKKKYAPLVSQALKSIQNGLVVEGDSFNKIQKAKLDEILAKKDAPVKPTVTSGSHLERFIQVWNDAPGKKSKHDLSKNTKVVGIIKGYFKELLSGKFWANRPFNPEWTNKTFKDCQWADLISAKNIDPGELIGHFEKSLQCYMDGMEPANKSWLPKDLPTFLYNQKSQKSMFAKFVMNPSKPLSAVELKVENPLVEYVLNELSEPWTPQNISIATQGVVYLEKSWNLTIDSDQYLQDFYREYQTSESFVYAFIEWYQDQDWIDNHNIHGLKPSMVNTWFGKLSKEFQSGDNRFSVRTK